MSNHPKLISIFFSISDSNKISIVPAALNQQTNDHDHHHNNNNNYLQLLQQREEENRQEVAKLTSEIRALKVQLIQLRSMSKNHILFDTNSLLITCSLFIRA